MAWRDIKTNYNCLKRKVFGPKTIKKAIDILSNILNTLQQDQIFVLLNTVSNQ